MMSILARLSLILSLPMILIGCATGTPRGVEPVGNFDADRYLGKWYEIARLDHKFERGLSHVCAEYSLRKDGRIAVLNRGWNAKKQQWKEANGVARFRESRDVASLSVTFFWPFAGGYHVIALDEAEYQWALVSGPNRGYLWILARDKELPEAVRNDLVARARALDFPVDELIWVDQTGPVPAPPAS